MKKLLLSLALLLPALGASAQSNGLNPHHNVEVRELTYNEPQPKSTTTEVLNVINALATGVISAQEVENYASKVEAAVRGAMSRVYRFTPVEKLADNEPGFIINGEITGVTSSQKTRKYEVTRDGKKEIKLENYYEGSASVSLTLTNNVTGEVLTQSFSAGSVAGWGEYIPTAEKAIDNAINQLNTKIASFCNRNYPIRANIVDRGAEKNDKTKQLYLDVGSIDRVPEDINFYIYSVGMVAGRETKKEIGRVRVNEVLGEDICICRVKKGSKDIKAALDAGVKLVAISE